MSKIDVSNWTIPAADAAKFSFTEPQESNIVFYNGTAATPENEVMRIDRNGVRVNPKLSTDEAADAVIRALDGYIKNLTKRAWIDLKEEDYVLVGQLCDTPLAAAEYAAHLLKEKNNG